MKRNAILITALAMFSVAGVISLQTNTTTAVSAATPLPPTIRSIDGQPHPWQHVSLVFGHVTRSLAAEFGSLGSGTIQLPGEQPRPVQSPKTPSTQPGQHNRTTPSQAPNSAIKPRGPAHTTPSGPNANELLVLTNQVRAQNGAGPVTVSQQLQYSAAYKAKDMATYNYFSHHARDSKRYDGLLQIRANQPSCQQIAEIIHKVHGPEARSQTVIDGWVQSKGHFRSLVLPAYNQTGIAVAKSADGTYYSVQHLCEVK